MPSKNFQYLSPSNKSYSNVFYKVVGKGKHVVLLHGFGEDGNIWKYQVDFLADHFKLIIPDLPGTGDSELIDDMSMEGMAAIVKSITDLEIPDQTFTLIGHSMGGYISLAFAELYPSFLNGMGLVHSSAFADPEDKKAARRKSIEFIRENGAAAFLKTSIPGLFSKQWATDNAPAVDELISNGENFKDEALILYYEAMMARPDRTDILKYFTKPVLMVIGEQDTAVPFSLGLQQASLPDISYIHILRDSGHMGMWEEKEKLNFFLMNYLIKI